MTDIHQAKTIRILIASPSDVAAERDIAERVIHRIELMCDAGFPLTLKARRWEFDVPAVMGKPAQVTINERLVDACDCAVCIFWTRIGTPTDNAEGGAVEELERMLAANKPVLLYFSDAVPESLSNIDPQQWLALSEWKKRLWAEKKGLPKNYKNADTFGELLKADLEKLLKSEFCEGSKRVAVSSKPAFSDLDRRYRATLTEELGKLKMLGSPDIDSVQVRLDDTFVPLRISHTWKTDERYHRRKREAAMQEEMRPHSPDELMRRVFPEYRLLLVIGDPGSGKTTLMKYYALCCLQGQQARLFGDDAGSVRVFFLPLRELKRDDAGQFLPLPEQLSVWSQARSNAIDPAVFDGWLRNADGARSLMLFDGLDEISDLERRKAACSWIDRQHNGFSETYFVVTSRMTGYRKTEGVELSADHIRADVMDFTPEQQAEFLSKWFRAAYCRELCPPDVEPEAWLERQKKEAEERTKTIVEYLAKEENRGLRELAAIPMMVQIMAILWKEREYLPGNRTKLYRAALDYLLEFRDERRQIPPLLPADKARLVLSPVALWMQQELEADEAERSAMHAEMEKVLGTLDHPPSAEALCKNLIDRAGLLVELGEERKEYLFRHKTFREYLAGGQLTETIKRNSGLIASLVEHFGEDWWSEPLTFFMAQADAGMFDKFMEALFDSEVSAEFSQKQQTLLETVIAEAPQKTTEALCKKLLIPETTANRQGYILDCLKTIGKNDAALQVSNFLNSVFSAHIEIATTEVGRKAVEVFNVLANQAIDANRLKHELDKFRQKESSNIITNPYEFDAQYIRIPGGKYIYSLTDKEVSIPEIWFAKYPVTNRQYRSFINFLGGKASELTARLTLKAYSEALYELANSGNDTVKGFDDYLKEERDFAMRFRSEYDDNRKYNKDEQPVVGVSWFGVRAYCLWLSMLSGSEYRLPTEQEWEWAAGGRREEPGKVLKVKEYPWGDKPEPTRKHANFDRNEGATTPVGRYPDGATPEGLYDIAGNVWEWMENWSNEFPKLKALCGGSWLVQPDALGCSARLSYYPDFSNDYHFGFRVVRPSPVF